MTQSTACEDNLNYATDLTKLQYRGVMMYDTKDNKYVTASCCCFIESWGCDKNFLKSVYYII